MRDLDVVQREEFEAVKEMARLAREENEALKARIAALEAKLGRASQPPRPRRASRLGRSFSEAARRKARSRAFLVFLACAPL